MKSEGGMQKSKELEDEHEKYRLVDRPQKDGSCSPE